MAKLDGENGDGYVCINESIMSNAMSNVDVSMWMSENYVNISTVVQVIHHLIEYGVVVVVFREHLK